MTDDPRIRQLQETLASYKAEMTRLKQAISGLQHVIETLQSENGARPAAPAPSPTQQTVAEVVLQILGESKRPLTLREIQERLVSRGREVSDQAVSFALKKLGEDDMVERRDAPPNSSARVAFLANREVA